MAWFLIDNADLDAEKERERMKYTILAANPHLYKLLYEDEQDGNEPRDEDVEWITPTSVEDIDAMERILSGMEEVGGEEF